MRNRVIVLVGPTSSGKTALALSLAEKYTGELISADSRQVYTYMDIGTGKLPIGSNAQIEKHPKVWLVNSIPIWGYDLVSPTSYFSVYDFVNFARLKSAQICKAGKVALLVGGTGFYISALTGKVVIESVKPDESLRRELEVLDTSQLLAKASSLGVVPVNDSEKANRHRLIRSIEKRCGKELVLSEEVIKTKKDEQKSQDKIIITLGLTAPREHLYNRIDAWVEAVWNNGLLTEVSYLQKLGYADTRPMKGIVYKTVQDYIAGLLSEGETISRIKYDLHAYVRKQQTYFAKYSDAQWFDITQDTYPKNIYNFIEDRLWINR